MTDSASQKANIQVKFVNEPREGRKNGTIKTEDDELYGVPPQKLGMFQPGGRYQIEYSTRSWKGQDYKTVISANLLAPPSTNSGGGGKYGRTDDATAERIFVCGALNAAIQGGHVELSSATLGNVVNMLRQVWSETFGVPQKNADMDGDQIPF